MKKVIAWIKGNPFLVAAAGVTVACLVLLTLMSFGLLPGLSTGAIAERETKVTQDLDKLSSLQRSPMQVPAENPDQPANTVTAVINDADVRALHDINTKMAREKDEVKKISLAQNARNHTPMYNGMFPDPANGKVLGYAVNSYRNTLERMLGRPRNDSSIQGLDADMPPPAAEVIRRIQEDMIKFIVVNFPNRTKDQLSPEELQKLIQHRDSELVKELEPRARQIHIYAERSPQSGAFPMDMGDWSQPNPTVTLENAWEQQLRLWVQQDICEAIALCNHSREPTYNVLNVPVKRLLGIRVAPGGTPAPGSQTLSAWGSAKFAEITQALGTTAQGTGAGGGAGVPTGRPVGGGNDMVESNPSAAPTPMGSPSAKIADDFRLSPTGRPSVNNPLYDVRYAAVSLWVDSTRLPELYAAIARVNFMTVVSREISDVDEIAELANGFYCGSADVVRVDIVIETLWLREFTIGDPNHLPYPKLMPKVVMQKLGIMLPTAPGTPGPGAPGTPGATGAPGAAAPAPGAAAPAPAVTGGADPSTPAPTGRPTNP